MAMLPTSWGSWLTGECPRTGARKRNLAAACTQLPAARCPSHELARQLRAQKWSSLALVAMSIFYNVGLFCNWHRLAFFPQNWIVHVPRVNIRQHKLKRNKYLYLVFGVYFRERIICIFLHCLWMSMSQINKLKLQTIQCININVTTRYLNKTSSDPDSTINVN